VKCKAHRPTPEERKAKTYNTVDFPIDYPGRGFNPGQIWPAIVNTWNQGDQVHIWHEWGLSDTPPGGTTGSWTNLGFAWLSAPWAINFGPAHEAGHLMGLEDLTGGIMEVPNWFHHDPPNEQNIRDLLKKHGCKSL